MRATSAAAIGVKIYMRPATCVFVYPCGISTFTPNRNSPSKRTARAMHRQIYIIHMGYIYVNTLACVYTEETPHTRYCMAFVCTFSGCALTIYGVRFVFGMRMNYLHMDIHLQPPCYMNTQMLPFVDCINT